MIRVATLTLVVTLAVLAFVPLAFGVAALVPAPPPPTPNYLGELLVDPENLRPEPAERAVFLAGLAFFASAFALALLTRLRERLEALAMRAPRAFAVMGAVLFALVAVVSGYGDHFFYHHLNALFFARWTWGVAIAVGVAVAYAPVRRMRFAPHVVAIGVTLVCATYLGSSVFTEIDEYVGYPDGHFEVMYFPLVRIMFGAPLVSECGSQYGAYAAFLSPVFHALGFGVATYSLVLGTLAAACLGALFVVLYRETGRLASAVGIWGAMFSFAFLAIVPYSRETRPEDFKADPYFQYLPVRVLFPVLALVFVSLERAARRRSHVVRWVAHGVLALGPLWNVEMGLVAWIAWNVLLGYRALEAHGVCRAGWIAAFRELGRAVLALAATVLVLGVAHVMLYHRLPPWGTFSRFQSLTFAQGVLMLPMRIPHTWMLVLLVYLIGLARGLLALRPEAPSPETEPASVAPSMIFFTAVLGVGVFMYFQGRSHDWVLLAVSYPAWLCGGLLCVEVVRALPSASRAGRAARLVLGAWLTSWILTGLLAFWDGRGDLADRLRQLDGPVLAEDDLALLGALPADKPPTFLSTRASVLYALTKTPPPFCLSMSEIFTRTDRDRLIDMVRATAGTRTLVVDGYFAAVTARHPAWAPLWNIIRRDYHPGMRAKSGMTVLVPNTRAR